MNDKHEVVVLGGGVAGLSAGYVLSKAGIDLVVCEKDDVVGGLCRTVSHNGYRFDLGGHRFFTKDPRLEAFVKELMGMEFIVSPRSSKIYFRGKYFDYPLKPFNALFGMGMMATVEILTDYILERIKNHIRRPRIVSLEDWVVTHFGRRMFELYFKDYSEKVWGLSCDRISEEWVSQRIKGLSLGVAIREALHRSNKKIPTLAERFLYPELGIGRIPERLKEEIVKVNKVLTNTRVTGIRHDGSKILAVETHSPEGRRKIYAQEFLSSMPISSLVKMLHPGAPKDVLDAANNLRYRDTIIVAVMVNRDRVTDLTWIYFPEHGVPFGRIHEPKNWSPSMAPPGKTVLVMEYFCFEGDETWHRQDKELAETTVKHLADLSFIKKEEVLDTHVVRVKKAYPLLEVGYQESYRKLTAYLRRFKNLQIIGRTGMFKYHNMDHAIDTGIKAAENFLGRRHDLQGINAARGYLEEVCRK
jgi:protoporphyrinogen oxidase